MITKEVAKLVHNCYTEIEEANKMAVELKKSLNEKGEFEIKDNCGNTRGLELYLRTGMSGATIKKVPFKLALDAISNHIIEQEKELDRLKEVCRIQLQ